MKEEIKNPKTSVECTIQIWSIQSEKGMKEMA